MNFPSTSLRLPISQRMGSTAPQNLVTKSIKDQSIQERIVLLSKELTQLIAKGSLPATIQAKRKELCHAINNAHVLMPPKHDSK
jgi:hypothetical protein